MTSHEETTKGWFARMQPPLAEQSDVEKLWYHLNHGIIDIIETDHAPHPIEKKMEAEEQNPEGRQNHETTCYGVPGIEFAIPQLLNQVRLGRLTLPRLIEVISTKPAEIIGIQVSKQSKVVWSNELYQIAENDIISGSRSSPFLGNLAVGKVLSLKTPHKELVKNNEIVDILGSPVLRRGDIV
jgi:dihydroorotase-like cyclic amidohydrolase